MSWATSRRKLAALTALCLAGCLSPTLPLPPPTEPEVTGPDEQGFVRLSGLAVPNAEVLAFNHQNRLLAGQLTGDSPRYSFVMPAEVGDYVELWYRKGNEQSESVGFHIPEPP